MSTTTPRPAARGPRAQRQVSLEVEGLTLRGTLHLPSAEVQARGSAPVAVLLHGFSGQRMENGRLFVDLARALADAGVAALAFDRAGHGESDGEFFDTSVGQDVRHTRAVLAALAQLPEVDETNLHLVGYSLGGVVALTTAAALAAEARDGSAAPGGVVPASVTTWSVAACYADDIRGGLLLGRDVKALDDIGFIDMTGQRIGRAIVEHALGFDPYAAAAGYPGPVLLVHGDGDFIPADCSRRLAGILGENARADVVPGADHGWSTVPHREHVIASTVRHVTRAAVL